DYTLFRYICNSVGGNCDDDNNLDITSLSPEELEEFTKMYMGNYNSVRQKILTAFHHVYASEQKAHNYCIGDNNNANITQMLDTYLAADYNADLTTPKLCSTNANSYNKRKKRYVGVDALYNSGDSNEAIANQLTAQVGYEYYTTTGACPMTLRMQLFLDGFFKQYTNADFTTNPFGYQGIYMAPIMFGELTGTGATSSNGTFTYTFVNGVLAIQANLVTQPNAITFTNYTTESDITEVLAVQETGFADGRYNFSALVRITDPSTSLGYREEVLQGNTLVALGNCSTNGTYDDTSGEPAGEDLSAGDTSCDKKERFTAAFTALLNDLAANGNLNATDYDLTTNDVYTQGYLPEFFDLDSNAITGTWTGNSNGTYRLNLNETCIGINLETNGVDLGVLTNSSSFDSFESVSIDNVTDYGIDEITLKYYAINSIINNVSATFNSSLNYSCCNQFSCINPINVGGICLGYEQDSLDYLEYAKPLLNLIISQTPALPYEGEHIVDIGQTLEFQNLINNYPLELAWENYVTNHLGFYLDFDPSKAIAKVRRTDNFLGDNITDRIFIDIYLDKTIHDSWTDPGAVLIEYTFEYPVFYDIQSIVSISGTSVVNSFIYNSESQPSLILDDTFILKIVKRSYPINGTTSLGSFCSFNLFQYYNVEDLINSRIINNDIVINNESTLCEPCIPDPVPLVSCTSGREDYVNYLGTLPNNGFATYEEEEFCNDSLQYLVDDYITYNTTFGITNSNHLYYLTLRQFGAITLNWGNAAIADQLIPAYFAYTQTYNVNSTSFNPATLNLNEDSWATFVTNAVTDSLVGPIPICSGLGFLPQGEPVNITVSDDCTEFIANVQDAYVLQAQEQYYNTMAHRFKQEYIEHVMGNVVETLDMSFEDKEYQYTLYYYDQAGNLRQTVPPEGVVRDEDITDAVAPDHYLETAYKYNSLNQLIWQQTPDGGVTRFAYDKLGRIIASQNAKQAIQEPPFYNKTFSYTKYDELGRIVEAGELSVNSQPVLGYPTYAINGNGELIIYQSDGTSEPVDAFMANSAIVKKEVTRTLYDVPLQLAIFPAVFSSSLFEPGTYEAYNARNRVTGVLYYKEITSATNLASDFEHALFYNYDIHGNVKELIEQNNTLALNGFDVHISSTQYQYDLISGNVHQVTFQKGKLNQFMHRYFYDADNRITSVETSSDGVLWEQDAAYEYYEHGPLARVNLGNKSVQGLDYAYTLQGWLKAVNSETVKKQDDFGRDGIQQNGNGIHKNIAQDAFGYALSYFNTDYTARHSQLGNNANAFKYSQDTTIPHTISNDLNLYNGNIKQMITGVRDLSTMHDNKVYGTQNRYVYDQLNRIKEMNGTLVDRTGNNVTYTSDLTKAKYMYDKNGNLRSIRRWAPSSDLSSSIYFDKLGYNYNTDSNGNKINNQLTAVNDLQGKVFLNDLDSQLAVLYNNFGIIFNPDDPATHNYVYDEIGQLIQDKSEGLTIDWRVDGKVKQVLRNDGTSPQTTITFQYDGLGNRVAKTTSILGQGGGQTTFYNRDAQGNVLSVLERNVIVPGVANTPTTTTVNQVEHHLYGSSRLGIEKKNVNLATLVVDPNSGGGSSSRRASIETRAATTAPQINSVTNNAIQISETETATWQEDKFFGFANNDELTMNAAITVDMPIGSETEIARINMQKPSNGNGNNLKNSHIVLSVKRLANGYYQPVLSLKKQRFNTNNLMLQSRETKVNVFSSNTSGSFTISFNIKMPETNGFNQSNFSELDVFIDGVPALATQEINV
ncbi:MAG: hypothetical protein HRT68_11185, partial [Flavobacteriaceae bacterium]|nr:hypothetical protein [Flavobacteriaceae bacterium]